MNKNGKIESFEGIIILMTPFLPYHQLKSINERNTKYKIQTDWQVHDNKRYWTLYYFSLYF